MTLVLEVFLVKPLSSRSTEVIKYIHQKSNASIPIIGVGGIHSAEDAIEKMKAGAVLIQLYTGFIYEGPSLIRKVNEEIINTEEVQMDEIKIIECPRDAMQGLSHFIPTDTKVEHIDLLLKCGFDVLDMEVLFHQRQYLK